MEATLSQEIQIKSFESPFQGDLENQLKEFLSSEEMRGIQILDIKYSCFFNPISIGIPSYTALVIYKK